MRGLVTIGSPVAIVLLTLMMPASATTLQQLSLDEMARQSTSIVRAKVFPARGMFRNGSVYTVYRIELQETLKSDRLRPVLTEMAIPGGVAGSIRQPVEGAPVLQEGAEYVLFLWTSRSGLTQIMGLSQGLFLVQAGTARREAASERILNAKGQPVRDAALVMPYSQLKSQIESALRSGSERASLGRGRR